MQKKKEVERKKNEKKNAEERVKLAEKVKLKAIAEAETAKKDFMRIM